MNDDKWWYIVVYTLLGLGLACSIAALILRIVIMCN